MADIQIRIDEMVAKLKKKGFRLTPQRIAVVKILAGYSHPGAEQIYECLKHDFPTISLATIYKTIGLLKEIGELMELGFGDQGNRYDGNKPYPHPHLICVKCRKIIDPDISGLDNVSVELAQETGFRIIHHRLDFFGVCPCCQNKLVEIEKSKG